MGKHRTTEELLVKLQEWERETKCYPAKLLIDADPDMPSVMAYRNRFGSWSKALIAAGIQPNPGGVLDKTLIAAKDLLERHGWKVYPKEPKDGKSNQS